MAEGVVGRVEQSMRRSLSRIGLHPEDELVRRLADAVLSGPEYQYDAEPDWGLDWDPVERLALELATDVGADAGPDIPMPVQCAVVPRSRAEGAGGAVTVVACCSFAPVPDDLVCDVVDLDAGQARRWVEVEL